MLNKYYYIEVEKLNERTGTKKGTHFRVFKVGLFSNVIKKTQEILIEIEKEFNCKTFVTKIVKL